MKFTLPAKEKAQMRIIKTVGLILAFGLLLSSVNAQEQKPELILQAGHNGGIDAVAFSSDGKTIASSGTVGTNPMVKLWDTVSGYELRTLKSVHNTPLAFSPDGTLIAYLVSEEGEKKTNIFQLATGRSIGTLPRAKVLSFSPDGKFIALSIKNNIELWDLSVREKVRLFSRHSDEVFSVSFSPDGQYIVSNCITKIGNYERNIKRQQEIKLWDVATGNELKSLIDDIEGINFSQVVYSPDGKLIAFTNNKTVKLWDVDLWKEFKSFKSYDEGILGGFLSLIFSPNNQFFAVVNDGGKGGIIRIWNTLNWKEGKPLESTRSDRIAFNPEGTSLLIAGFGFMRLLY